MKYRTIKCNANETYHAYHHINKTMMCNKATVYSLILHTQTHFSPAFKKKEKKQDQRYKNEETSLDSLFRIVNALVMLTSTQQKGDLFTSLETSLVALFSFYRRDECM